MAKQRKLDMITILGFQSIRELRGFELGDLNVLIGPNGAGKSNFINFFRMLSEMVEQNLQEWVEESEGADRILSFGIEETEELYAALFFERNGYEFTLAPTDDNGLVFTSEYLYFEGDQKDKWVPLGSGYREAQLRDEVQEHRRNIAYYCYEAISSWRIFHFHDTSATAHVKQWVSLEDDHTLYSDAANLAAFLYRLQRGHPRIYHQIRKTVQLAIPFFDDFVLEPRTLQGDDQQVRLLWRQVGSDYPMWPSQLSDGSIRFICLVTALLQPNPPSTIIIDEPELGLHPYAITLLGSLMRSASQRMQLIVSTQSVPLLNEFAIDDLIVVERVDGASVFKRLNEADFTLWLEEYTIGELWEKNILGGRP